jgi:trans-aconitate methyltransferase
VGFRGQAEFDRHAATYDEELARGIRLSGESQEYFAAGRVAWLGACLARLGVRPQRLLDFGCGTGASAPYLTGLLPDCALVGVDVSEACVVEARRRHGSGRVSFQLAGDGLGASEFDLAFCNGVFHHIAPAERAHWLGVLQAALRAGGLLALWENNPWNPGTRLVMKRIPLDREAVTLSARAARRLVQRAGFGVLAVDFHFYFPRWLRWLRGLEGALTRWPFGAQYQVLARKP